MYAKSTLEEYIVQLFTCDRAHLTIGFTFERILSEYFLTLGEWESSSGSLIELKSSRPVTAAPVLVTKGKLEDFRGNSLATLVEHDANATHYETRRSFPTILVHINARKLTRRDRIVPGSWEQIEGRSIPIMGGKLLEGDRVVNYEHIVIVADGDILKVNFDGDPIVLRHHQGFIHRLSHDAFRSQSNPFAGGIVDDLFKLGERFKLER